MPNKDYEGGKGGSGKGINDGRLKGSPMTPGSADFKEGPNPNESVKPPKLPQQGGVAE